MAVTQDPTVIVRFEGDAGSLVKAGSQADAALGKNTDSVQRMIKALQDQEKRLNSTALEYAQYRAATMGATREQQVQISSLMAQIDAHKRLNVGMTGTTRQLRFMRGGFGQVGHQIQDIAVQLQMGTNAMLVFGQQGSQILSLFGPWGAMAGAVGAVGAAIFTYSQATKEAKQPTKELRDEVDALVDGFGELGRNARNVALIRIADEAAKTEKAIRMMRFEQEGWQKAIEHAEQGVDTPKTIDEMKRKIDDLTLSLDASQKKLEVYYEVMFNPGGKQKLPSDIKVPKSRRKSTSEDDFKARQKLAQEELDFAIWFDEMNLRIEDESRKRREKAAQEEVDLQRWLTEEQDKQARHREEIARREYEVKLQTLTALQGAFGTIAKSGEDATDAQRAAFLAQQAIAVATIIMSTHEAAAKASAFVAGAGPGAWLASRSGIMAIGYASAGMVAGQSLASFEGGGITFNGVRSGGIDGRGGKMAVVHPNEKITDLEKGGVDSTPVQVSFQISANDTRGFDQLLQSRRGLIVNMINQAMNNAGRRGVT